MAASPTYPGIYIEELPGPAETITPAPTSVTVFVGYTHPYKTQTFGQPVEIFSFTDYQREFGGLYNNAWLDSNVAYAVQQFFLNGGSDAFVFGLQSSLFQWTAPVPPAAQPPPAPGTNVSIPLGSAPNGGPSVTISGILTFSGLEPIDSLHTMTVTVSNISSSTPPGAAGSSSSSSSAAGSSSSSSSAASSTGTFDLADYTIAYGSVVETFRRVSLLPQITSGQTPIPNPNFIETRINGVSQLVWVSALPSGTSFYNLFPSQTAPPAPPTPPNTITVTLGLPVPFPPVPFSINSAAFSAGDFTNTTIGPFVEDGPLDKVPIFNLMVIPGVTDASVWAQAIAFCERKRAFLILDPPPNYSADGMPPPQPGAPTLPAIATIINQGVLPNSINAALYFPYLTSNDPLSGNPIRLPPSGTVAGIFATTDSNRGVWKAPAGLETVVNNITGVVPEGILTDNRQGVLNPLGVNCLRTFPGIGTVVFGARTTTTQNPSLQQWRYVPVRRMALFIEQTLYANLGWVVFEPNDTPLWNAITTSINAFMLTLFHQGAFQGATASAAFQVRCDSTTTTQADINNGIVNILVAFAPLKPAEFVVIQIAQLAGQSQS